MPAITITTIIIYSVSSISFGQGSEVVTKSMASQHCSERNLTLPRFSNGCSLQGEVKQTLLATGVSAWLELAFSRSEDWTWTTGALYKGSVIGPSKENATCAYVRTASSYSVRPTDCFVETDGFICHRKACQSDDLSRFGRQRIGNTCMIYMQRKVNWYEAVSACTELGGTLVDSEEDLDTAGTNISERLEAWIGLTRGSWGQSNGGPQRKGLFCWYPRFTSSPGQAMPGCAKVIYSYGAFWAVPTECQSKHSVVCVNTSFEGELPPNKTDNALGRDCEREATHGLSLLWIIMSSVVGGTALLGALELVVIFVKRLCKGREEREITMEAEDYMEPTERTTGTLISQISQHSYFDLQDRRISHVTSGNPKYAELYEIIENKSDSLHYSVSNLKHEEIY